MMWFGKCLKILYNSLILIQNSMEIWELRKIFTLSGKKQYVIFPHISGLIDVDTGRTCQVVVVQW